MVLPLVEKHSQVVSLVPWKVLSWVFFSVWDYITNIQSLKMKPIEGAESEGALGFFKGVGKGLVGWVYQNFDDNPTDNA